MQNTFTCGHGHLQQLAAFAHVPQKRTRCIHHGPRGVTTSCLATRSGGGTMGSRHKAQVVLTFVCALQLVLYKQQQQKHICFACFACSIAYSSQQLAHRAVSDCSSWKYSPSPLAASMMVAKLFFAPKSFRAQRRFQLEAKGDKLRRLLRMLATPFLAIQTQDPSRRLFLSRPANQSKNEK